MTLVPKVRDLLAASDARHILLTGGGIIPEKDLEVLEKEEGIGRFFGPGTPSKDFVDYIQDEVGRRRQAQV